VAAGRPTDWHIVGRDTDPTPGDPEVLIRYERYFRGRSDDAHERMFRLRDIQSNVNSLDLEGSWITAIWGRCDYLAEQLTPEWSVHQEVAQALAVFRRQLPDLQRDADHGLRMARGAIEARDHATGRLHALSKRNAATDDTAEVCAPATGSNAGRGAAWQRRLDHAESTLKTAKGLVDTAAANFHAAVTPVVTALRDAEQTLGTAVLRPAPPDTDTGRPKSPPLALRVVEGFLAGVDTAAAVTAATLKGADGIGTDIDLMMLGGPADGGPGTSLADSPAAGPLADAYATGRSPFADYDTGPADLSGGWLTAWEKAGGDVRDHPRNQLPYVPPPPQTGPGEWVLKPERMGQNAADHQEAATGARWPWVYRYGGKDWDGFEDGHLIDAKDNYNGFIKNGKFNKFMTLSETSTANKAVARSNGYPIRYVCSNPTTAQAFKSLFRRAGIPIQVTVIGD
jgi:hypothetical protein